MFQTSLDPDQAQFFLLGLIWVQTVCKDYKQITLADRVKNENELRHEISNNMVCATSKASDQPAQMRSLIKAFASHLTILRLLSY